MKNIENKNESKELEWGQISTTEILKKMYNTKNINEMSNEEIDQMVADLI